MQRLVPVFALCQCSTLTRLRFAAGRANVREIPDWGNSMSGANDHENHIKSKVSRLPPMPLPPDPITQKMFDEQHARGGHILNMHLVNAHAPRLADAKRKMTYALRNECKATRKMRELVIVRTAALCEQPYELKHHYPMALQCGFTEAQVKAAMGDWREEHFEPAERALLAYVDCLCLKRGDVPDDVFAELARYFSPQEIVELTHTSTTYWATGVFIRAMQIEIDPEDRTTAMGKF